MNFNSKILVFGGNGMLGSALLRVLSSQGFDNVAAVRRTDADLTSQKETIGIFSKYGPEYVFMPAAKVGGILANKRYPAEFLEQNLLMQLHVMRSALDSGVKKLCFFGSSCIYPRLASQPMTEGCLLDGKLEPTNEGYALAKIVGLKLLEFYQSQYEFDSITVIPCNLYGTNDHFDLESAHVLSSLVRRFVDAMDRGAPSVTVWGTGQARREFMHVDDAAEIALSLMRKYQSPAPINIGPGTDVSIAELASIVAQTVGYLGAILYDTSKPDGMPRKCMEVSRMKALGLSPKISLADGIARTISEYNKIKKKETLL